MSDRQQAIQKHTADMLAVERHILEAIERQREDDDLREHAEANSIVIEIERTLKRHITALEQLAHEKDTGVEATFKKAVTEVLGAVAGLYDKVREHPVSRMLRDDYVALSLAAMSYTAFHTFGLAVKEPKIADLAEEHLRDLTPLLVRLSKVLPHVVAAEVAEEVDDYAADATVGDTAEMRTQRAWQPEVTEVV